MESLDIKFYFRRRHGLLGKSSILWYSTTFKESSNLSPPYHEALAELESYDKGVGGRECDMKMYILLWNLVF